MTLPMQEPIDLFLAKLGRIFHEERFDVNASVDRINKTLITDLLCLVWVLLLVLLAQMLWVCK